MPRLRASADAALFGALLLVGIAQVGAIGPQGDRWSGTLWTLLLTAPLLGRRRYPATAAIVLGLAGLVHDLLEPTASPFVAVVVAALLGFYSAGAFARLRPALGALAVGLAAFWVGDIRDQHPLGEYLASAVLVVGPWAAGRALRVVRARNERLVALTAELAAEREARARDAVLAERARIAGELHDVVGHSVSVISLQAQAAEAALASDPALVRGPLTAISSAAQSAMTEMRRLVSLLHSDDGDAGDDRDAAGGGPVPGHADLRSLTEENRNAGLDVRLVLEGDPPDRIPAGVQLATFRIVQEGLTNVRRHSGASTALVTVRVAADAVLVDVVDEGPALGAHARPRPGEDASGRGGFGLVGVRARASSCSGRMEAGPCGPGWALRAVLPFGPESAP